MGRPQVEPSDRIVNVGIKAKYVFKAGELGYTDLNTFIEALLSRQDGYSKEAYNLLRDEIYHINEKLERWERYGKKYGITESALDFDQVSDTLNSSE